MDPYDIEIEPSKQGAKRYVVCKSCGAELLVELGGWDKLTHKENCEYAQEEIEA